MEKQTLKKQTLKKQTFKITNHEQNKINDQQ